MNFDSQLKEDNMEELLGKGGCFCGPSCGFICSQSCSLGCSSSCGGACSSGCSAACHKYGVSRGLFSWFLVGCALSK